MGRRLGGGASFRGYNFIHSGTQILLVIGVNFLSIQMMFLSIVSLLWYIPEYFFTRFDLSFMINAIWSIKLIQILRYTR